MLLSEESSSSHHETRIYSDPTHLPNVLLAGAPKSGTTATAHYLTNHSIVCVSQTNGQYQKEPHYFDKNEYYQKYRYEQWFSHCPKNALKLDATPNNIWYARRIYQYYQDVIPVKILFLLREPVARELSWYHHMVRLIESDDRSAEWARKLLVVPDSDLNHTKTLMIQTEGSNRSVLTFSQHVERNIRPRLDRSVSAYVTHLREWFNYFDRRNNILVLNYDEVKRFPMSYLRRLHAFLNVSDVHAPHTLPMANAYQRPAFTSARASNRRRDCQVQDRLATWYEPYNQELYQLLHDQPGPTIEQRPFPRFRYQCTT